MLRAREGRGSQAEAELRRAVRWRLGGLPAGEFRFLRPDDHGIPLPLGWMLSGSARGQLDREIILKACASDDLGPRCRQLGASPPDPALQAAIAAAPRCGVVRWPG
jgi:hypothetical protein